MYPTGEEPLGGLKCSLSSGVVEGSKMFWDSLRLDFTKSVKEIGVFISRGHTGMDTCSGFRYSVGTHSGVAAVAI